MKTWTIVLILLGEVILMICIALVSQHSIELVREVKSKTIVIPVTKIVTIDGVSDTTYYYKFKR